MGLAAGGVALASSTASAQIATGGAGRFVSSVDWVTWGSNGDPLDLSGPVTRQSTSTYNGVQFVVSCTVSNAARTGGGTPDLHAYLPGTWHGDAFDELYNQGGVGGSNTLVSAIATSAQEVSFDFDCSATLGGNPYPLEGLVVADAEQSSNAEHVTASVADTATWRLIDRYRTPDCTSDSQVTRSDAAGQTTVRLDNPSGGLCAAGPAGVVFADGATSGRVTLRGSGTSAVALGAVVTFDHGDADPSYGDAAHALHYAFTGGVVPVGTTALHAADLAHTTQPAVRLGASVDPDSGAYSATADGDDLAGSGGAFGPADDEDGLLTTTVTGYAGGTAQVSVSCSGEGATVAGWLDFGNDGTFGAGDAATPARCTGGLATPTFTIPTGPVAAGQHALRLRIASDPAQVASPAGLATDGEVEDHLVDVQVRQVVGLCEGRALGLPLGIDLGKANLAASPCATASDTVASINPFIGPPAGLFTANVKVDALNAASTNGATAAHGESSIAKVTISVPLLGISIQATGLHSESTASLEGTCAATALSSISRLATLSINGIPLVVGDQSLTIPLVVGSLRINELASTGSSITRRVLDLDLPGTALDVVLGESRAGVVCPT
jgi:hypothetical protein